MNNSFIKINSPFKIIILIILKEIFINNNSFPKIFKVGKYMVIHRFF